MRELKEVKDAWDIRKKEVVFTTVDKEGIPNSVYVAIVFLYDKNTIVIADNKFDKTNQNIASGSTASILFITDEYSAYQIKGSIKCYTDGPIYDAMKKVNKEGYPGHKAVAINIEEVYKGAEKLA
jgi:uncharacterized protein